MSIHSTGHHDHAAALSGRAAQLVLGIGRMVSPLLLQITDNRQVRRIAALRRQTRAEIANLPASLQQDVAFSKELKHNDP